MAIQKTCRKYMPKKKQKSLSIPEKYYNEIAALFEEFKDVCEDFEIKTPSKLLRILANLGRSRFEEAAEHARKARNSGDVDLEEKTD